MDCSTCHKAWRCTFACPEMNEVFGRIEDELTGQYPVGSRFGFDRQVRRTGPGA